MTHLESTLVFISSAIGRQAYGQCDIFLYMKPTVATQATLFNKVQEIFPPEGRAHTTTFDGLVVDHRFEWKIAQTANAATMQVRSDDPTIFTGECSTA